MSFQTQYGTRGALRRLADRIRGTDAAFSFYPIGSASAKRQAERRAGSASAAEDRRLSVFCRKELV
ncbi:MAG: hypothetical protein ACE5E1_08765, partial [Phycisphaerae bacterium]